MPFFGPGGLSGSNPKPASGLDPELLDALMAQFPGLAQLGQQPQQPSALQGYQWPGQTFFPGQGQQGFGNLSPFEGAKGFGSESITAGLALGNFGKSSSQQSGATAGAAAQPFSLGALSLPSLALPQAVAAQQGGFGEGMGDVGAPTGEPAGGMTIGAGDVLGGAQQAIDLFGGSALGQQTPTPGTTEALAEQRAGERVDYSNATGSPGGIPQLPAPIASGPGGNVAGFGAAQTPGLTDIFGGISGGQPQIGAPGMGGFETGGIGPEMQGDVMFAPGGSAANALGAPGEFQSPTAAGGPQGDLLGGGISTLQGLLSLYQGAQSGDVGQLLGGAGGTLGGISQLAPETMAQLSQTLGLGSQGLGLAGGALGGLAGGYGLYQGIEGGDPLQALSGAAGLYSGMVPVINSLLGSNIPSLTQLGTQLLQSIAPSLGQSAGAAGTAGAAGATAGQAAGGVAAGASGAIAAAPLAAMAISTGLYNMFDKQAGAEMLAKRFGDLQGNIPGHVAAWQKVPALLEQIQQTNDPAEAARLYGEVQKIQSAFDSSGMEDFLQKGYTSVGGQSYSHMTAPFQQGPEYMKALSPYMQMADYGRMLASDKAARGGVNIPGALSAEQYALSMGGDAFNERYRPAALLGSGENGQGYLLNLLGGMHAATGGAVQAGAADPNNPVDQATLNFLGRFDPMFLDPARQAKYNAPAGAEFIAGAMPGEGYWADPASGTKVDAVRTGGFTNQDVLNYLERGAGSDIMNVIKNDYGLYDSAWDGGVGKTDRSLRQQLQGMQPGGIEQGLRDMFTQGGFKSNNPFFSGEFAQQQQQMQANDPTLQALQQYMSQLQGVQGGLPQLTQGLQQQVGAGLDSGVLAALQPSGFAPGGNQSGGGNSGIDLQALLRQMGLVAA
jgi:hypothetical protein